MSINLSNFCNVNRKKPLKTHLLCIDKNICVIVRNIQYIVNNIITSIHKLAFDIFNLHAIYINLHTKQPTIAPIKFASTPTITAYLNLVTLVLPKYTAVT